MSVVDPATGNITVLEATTTATANCARLNAATGPSLTSTTSLRTANVTGGPETFVDCRPAFLCAVTFPQTPTTIAHSNNATALAAASATLKTPPTRPRTGRPGPAEP